MALPSVADRAFPEISAACEARVNEVLSALARLQSADAAIAARQLVRATKRGDARTCRTMRGCRSLLERAGQPLPWRAGVL